MSPHFSTEQSTREIDIHELIEIANALDKFEIIFGGRISKNAIFMSLKNQIYSPRF